MFSYTPMSVSDERKLSASERTGYVNRAANFCWRYLPEEVSAMKLTDDDYIRLAKLYWKIDGVLAGKSF